MAKNDVSIMIVDDNPAKLLALRAALEGMDLTIIVAHSGAEALRLLLLQDFAAVLLDVNMPGMDGFETADLIRQRLRSEHLPIIFITAERLADAERLRGYQLGAVDYILSPIQPEIIRAKVAVFADLFKLRGQALQDARKLKEKKALIEQQYQQLETAHQDLQNLNQNLERRVAEEVMRSREKDHQLIQQSRLAVMGEMIGNIAHQWRQPLNALALVLGNIQDADQQNELTSEYLTQQIGEGWRLIEKMSTTINDFRDFFRPDKQHDAVLLSKAIANAVGLVAASFTAHNIKITLDIVEELWAQGSANEYSQVILNLLSNAKEIIAACEDKRAGSITIRLSREGNQACLTVADNGGGISQHAQAHLFEPYFSTKAEGTGIGLYMSKMIIESSFNGKISAHNEAEGAVFEVWTPLPIR